MIFQVKLYKNKSRLFYFKNVQAIHIQNISTSIIGAMSIGNYVEVYKMNKALVYKVNEVAEIINKPSATVRNEIRKGKIKAVKSGTEYLIEKSEVDRYLGIETNDGSLKKDLEIAELKGKIKSLETQINAFKQVASSLNHIIEM
jgi:excisionase family DNA binding protein